MADSDWVRQDYKWSDKERWVRRYDSGIEAEVHDSGEGLGSRWFWVLYDWNSHPMATGRAFDRQAAMHAANREESAVQSWLRHEIIQFPKAGTGTQSTLRIKGYRRPL